MLHNKTTRAIFSLPAALAIAFVSALGSAYATPATQQTALNDLLRSYALNEGKTAAQISAYNVTTATADDLVFAVYDLAKRAGTTDPSALADIAQAALLPAVIPANPATAKVRADKDVVAGRIMESVVVSTLNGAGVAPANESTIVTTVLTALGTVNSGFATTKQLTLAGKEKVVAYALKSTTGLGAAIATTAATLYTPAGTTPTAQDTARTAFNVAVLKLLAFKPITNDPALALPTKGTYYPIIGGNQKTVVGQPAFVEGTPPAIVPSGGQFGIEDYIDTALDKYTFLTKAAAALNIAAGVSATVPSAAGATIGGYVKDLKTAGGATATDAAILTYLKGTPSAPANSTTVPPTAAKPAVPGIITNAKLAASVSDIVADVFKQLAAGTHANDAIALATSSKASTGVSAITVSVALKGKIASGAIRAVPGDAANVVNGILALNNPVTGKPEFAQTAIAAFAQAAAIGNSTAAPTIATTAIGKITFVPAAGTAPTAAAIAKAQTADNTKIEAVAIGVGKSVALVDPDSVDLVAEALFSVQRNGSNPYTVTGVTPADNTTRVAIETALAGRLAKGLLTNYTAAGAAVAGVVHESLINGATAGAITTSALAQDLVASITGTAIKNSTKGAVMIALKVAASAPVRATYSSGSTSITLAAKIAGDANVAATYAGAVAAGVSLADTANTGAITAAVINAGTGGANVPGALQTAHQKAALTIANTVAINVDVEAIGLIAQSVGALLQPAGSTSPLPKLTTIGTLTTSLAKAINTKPLVLQANRVDELNELAAELTKQYLAKVGVDGVNTGGTVDATELKTLATGLSSIGTSIFKAVSAKKLADTFNNAVDVADIADGVAGAIAQVIATSGLNVLAKDQLLTSNLTGSLIKNLVTAATASKSTTLVTGAFLAVAGTKTGGAYGTVTGTTVRGDGTTGRFENGVNYEVGVVNDPETPIKNI